MSLSVNFPTVRPSLSLDFASTKRLDPRITFTRAATAKYYDGVITAKAEENLLIRSQEFDDAAWTKTRSTVTANADTAPDGTVTADALLQASGQTNSGLVSRASDVTALDYVASVFAKPNGKNILRFVETLSSGATRVTYFNVSTGAVGTKDAAHTAVITASTNGYYRCSIAFSVNAARNGSVFIALADTDGSATVTDSGGLYIWGAQFEQRSAVTAYTPTTTQAITNYIPVLQTAAADTARFDHNPTTGESLGLLIEEARTNLLTYSEQFDNAAWAKATGSTVLSNAIIAPDGALTADRYITNSGTLFTATLINQVVTTAAGTYTFSCYAKAGGYDRVVFNLRDNASSLNTGTVTVSIVDGSIVSSGSTGTFTGASAVVTAVGNGWYRVALTCTTTGATAFQCRIWNQDSTITSGNGYSGIFIWGAQLEAGAFATSYIPTVASTVTRAADAASMTGTNFSSWYRADEGTMYVEAKANAAIVAQAFASIDDGSTNNAIYLVTSPSNSGFDRYQVNVSGTAQASLGGSGFVATNQNKMAGAYKLNDFERSLNGASLTDTLGTVPVVNALKLGSQAAGSAFLNGTIKKFAYYPKRITSAQMQALTLS